MSLLIVAAVVVVAIVATGGAGHETGGPHLAAAGAATVRRRNLVTSEHATGKIRYARSSTVANRLQGTLTWVPAVGRVIDPGQRLFAVDNFPVILMNGTTPAYRTLDASDSPGPDVRQLNANLIGLGFDPGGIVDDDAWQPATTAGVEALQAANGVPQTGSLALGTIVFLRGAQRIAGLQGGATAASEHPTGGHDEFVDYTRTAPPRSADALEQVGAAISKLGTAVRQLRRQDQRLARAMTAARRRKSPKGPADPGPVTGGDSPVMTTTSTNLVVTVDVPAGGQGVTRVGAHVPVVMPSGNTVRGRVVKIGQATAAGDRGGSTVPITIHLDKHENARSLDQATVSVTFVEKTARHVLSVPVTALLARPGERYAVQEADAPHKLIDVRLGTFATGYVQVSGRGLRPGLRVTDSQG